MKTVNDYLKITAGKFPEKNAFVDEKREMTFRQLLDESSALSLEIAASGIKKQPICIYMDKRVECISSMLGITGSGNFYTVLDVNMPAQRIDKILEVLKPAAFITCRENLEQLKVITANKKIFIYEELISDNNYILNEEKLCEIRSGITPDSTMFVLFTSGSTGVPKGVIIPYRGFEPYLEWYRDTFNFDETTVFANQSPFYFIMSCPDIYVTILTGATCYIVPKKAFSFPMVTLEYLKSHHINTIYWVPSALCLIANFRALPEVHLDELKTVLFGGEVMPSKQLNMWRREYPNVRFANLYGPTETTEMISFFDVKGEIDDAASLPIGIPTSYIKVILLDENNKEVGPGEIGELCACGISIADGYYDNPEKTAEVFMDNPLLTYDDEPEMRRMYRTGDLAKIDESGNLIYCGRKDFQIKHMGNRIELGEIETAVSSLDEIDENCCLYDTKKSKIVLFYTGSACEDSIINALGNMLPVYMIPNRIEKLDVLPKNVNGKTDRTALKEMI